MRYVVALVVAAVITVALLVFQWRVDAELTRVVRGSWSDTGGEVSPALMRQVQVADLLATYWPVWVPLLVGGCLLVARQWPGTNPKTAGS